MPQIKSHHPSQIDVPVPDRRDVREDVVGKGPRVPIRRPLNAVCVPGHHDIGQKGQGARYRVELLGCPPALGGDGAIVDGALEAVNGLALVEKIQDFGSDCCPRRCPESRLRGGCHVTKWLSL